MLIIIMLNVLILSVGMLSVVMPSVVMLSVVATSEYPPYLSCYDKANGSNVLKRQTPANTINITTSNILKMIPSEILGFFSL
jgi:hypothetical protein